MLSNNCVKFISFENLSKNNCNVMPNPSRYSIPVEHIPPIKRFIVYSKSSHGEANTFKKFLTFSLFDIDAFSVIDIYDTILFAFEIIFSLELDL